MSSFLKCAVQVLCQVHPNGSIYYYYLIIIWGLFKSIRGLDIIIYLQITSYFYGLY